MTTTSPAASGETPAARRLPIEIWSDLGCPWCYVGKARLEKAIAASPHADSIDLVIRSFELDPTMAEAGRIPEYLAQKMGVSLADAERMDGRVAALAQGEGLPYAASRVHANSFNAHRVVQFAATKGLAAELLSVLQRELFSGRANVYESPALIEAAVEVGLPGERVEQILAGDEFAAEVRADEQMAAEIGITGVPFTVLDERFAVPGASSTAGYAMAIAQAWGDDA